MSDLNIQIARREGNEQVSKAVYIFPIPAQLSPHSHALSLTVRALSAEVTFACVLSFLK